MKLKKTFLLITVLVAVFGLCLLMAGTAYAEPLPETGLEESVETGGEQSGAEEPEKKTDLSDAADKFREYLKERYGADYDYYYNKIIAEWGSIEEYLLSFGEKLPEEYKTGWDKFVGWLGEYSAVWAPPFAVAIVIIVAVVGKKQFNRIVERIVNARLAPIVKELNSQSKATVSIIRAQTALLGNGEKFAPVAAELRESEKELMK